MYVMIRESVCKCPVQPLIKKIQEQRKKQGRRLLPVQEVRAVKQEQATQLEEYINEKYDYLDIEIIYGGQPLYYYIISIE